MRASNSSATPLDIAALCAELEINTQFGVEALDEAQQVSTRQLPNLPDATDIDLVTIDPPTSLDLDQAVSIETRESGGWIVHYAIADVATFVKPGGPVDLAARERGETLYAPDRRIPLYPDALGQGAMSLLPGVDRPALVWRIEVDGDGEPGTVELRRAIVRSRAKLSYDQVQHFSDTKALPEAIAALPRFGQTRHQRAIAHGAIELDLPDQQVDKTESGWQLSFRRPLPAENWNAQVSLLTGAAAAHIMIEGRIGFLRTLPDADDSALHRLKQAAEPLGVHWQPGATPGQVLASLNRADPRHIAFIDLAGSLLRGAGYRAFHGELPEITTHAGIGGTYAHVTAPIRRLCDRFANEVCVALVAGKPVPNWASEALDALVETMATSNRRAHSFERAIVDGTEAAVLAPRVGEQFVGVIVDVEKADANSTVLTTAGAHAQSRDRGTILLDDPAVSARVEGAGLPLGSRVTVHLDVADPSTRHVRFTFLSEINRT